MKGVYSEKGFEKFRKKYKLLWLGPFMSDSYYGHYLAFECEGWVALFWAESGKERKPFSEEQALHKLFEFANDYPDSCNRKKLHNILAPGWIRSKMKEMGASGGRLPEELEERLRIQFAADYL